MGQRSRVKRKAVQSDDGWTVITHGPTKVSLKEGEEKEIGSLPDAVNGLSTDLLAKDFQARQERWKDSGCMKQLDGILKNRKWDVVEAVCIGIGSFSRDWEHRHRALWQLVLFMHVVTIREWENPDLTYGKKLKTTQYKKNVAECRYMHKIQPSLRWTKSSSRSWMSK